MMGTLSGYSEHAEGLGMKDKSTVLCCNILPAVKTLAEFRAEDSEYPSVCLSSASSRAAASCTRNIKHPISIWALMVSVSTWRALTSRLMILGLRWLKLVSGTLLSAPGTSSLMGMLAKCSGRPSRDWSRWMEFLLRSPRLMELRRLRYNVMTKSL